MTEIVSSFERRVHPRMVARSTVRVKAGTRSKMCKCLDLSAKGVAIATSDFNLSPNEKVELHFILNFDTLIKVHKRDAIVRYVRSGVTGLEMNPCSGNFREGA